MTRIKKEGTYMRQEEGDRRRGKKLDIRIKNQGKDKNMIK